MFSQLVKDLFHLECSSDRFQESRRPEISTSRLDKGGTRYDSLVYVKWRLRCGDRGQGTEMTSHFSTEKNARFLARYLLCHETRV